MRTLAILALLGLTVRAGIRVSGNRFVNDWGSTVVLQGFSHSGTEYMCVQAGQIFEGPTDDAAIERMLDWNINAVRIPLNEHCWLGINGANPGGETYKNAIADYVNRLTGHGLYVILDLHWTKEGGSLANAQEPMSNREHSIAFWQDCASWFKDNENVIFDLFNEPFLNNRMGDYNAAWRCWRDGGWCDGLGFEVAGMQDMINAVRGAGSNNVLILGGLTWANDLSKWMEYLPHDPQNNFGASTHLYNFNYCNDFWCWNSQLDPIASHYPLVVGEFGQNDCSDWYVQKIFAWFKQGAGGVQHSHIAWTYNTWDCGSGPALITDYYGGCTNYGCAVRSLYKSNSVVSANQGPANTTVSL